MTYKTRQEVLRAAADWMDVCEKAGVEARCKVGGSITRFDGCSFYRVDNDYEFPLALLEGKEVWIGSELYCIDKSFGCYGEKTKVLDTWKHATWKAWSWNPPKPKTVMVEMYTSDVENIVRFSEVMHITIGGSEIRVIADACKKALEKL